MKKLVLDLFSGSKCVSNYLESIGYEVISLDILKETNPTIRADILQDNIIEVIENKVGNRQLFSIWASPPCEKWSLGCGVKGGNIYFESIKENNKIVDIKIRENFFKTQYNLTSKPNEVKRLANHHIKILERTIEIINYFKPLHYVIENPFGYMQYYITKLKGDIKINLATYCQYGFSYRKPTNLFSDLELNLKSCRRGDPCHKNNFYNRGKENKIRNKSICNNYLERSSIPIDLIDYVFRFFETYEELYI